MVGKYRAIRLSRSAPGSSSLDQRVPFSYRSSFHGSPLRWYPCLSQKPGCVARVRIPLGGSPTQIQWAAIGTAAGIEIAGATASGLGVDAQRGLYSTTASAGRPVA